MKRVLLPERANWQQAHQEIGFLTTTTCRRGMVQCIGQKVAYGLASSKLNSLKIPRTNYTQMCLEVAGDMIQRGHYPEYFQIPPAAIL